MPGLRMSMRGAIVLSVLAHALGLAAFIEVSRERQAGLTPIEQADQPPIEVEILADPRSGAPDGEDTVAEQPAVQPATPPAEQAPPPTASSEARPEQPPTEQAEAPAATPPPPPAMPPPEEPPPPTAPPQAAPTQTPVTLPPRTTTAQPPSATPPARPRAGSGSIGRADGTTDIILGNHTVPAGLDPSPANVPPRYPREASQRGQQGVVRLSVLVATDGTALAVEVAQSSGYPLLDHAAREAVAKWHFRPGLDGGIAVPSTMPVTLSFVLNERR